MMLMIMIMMIVLMKKMIHSFMQGVLDKCHTVNVKEERTREMKA